MKKIAIIGVGLIGGSLGMALKGCHGGDFFVIGIGRDIKKLKLAKKLGAIDEFSTEFSAASKVDIVVICTPVDIVGMIVKNILPHIKESCIITDAGGVKELVINDVKKVLKEKKSKINFVGSHPMAGKEKNGIKSATSRLFNGATVILTPELSNQKSLNLVRELWQSCGANVIEMPCKKHDEAVALVSHIPHIIAFSISELCGKKLKKIPELLLIAASSFKDITRVALSNPTDWAVICNSNKSALNNALGNLLKILSSSHKALKAKDKLEKQFSAGHKSKKEFKSNKK